MASTADKAEAAARLKRHPDAVHRSDAAGESCVVLQLSSGQYHGLNGMGLLVWTLIDGEHTEADVIAEVRARVADPPPDIDATIGAFLHELRERELIVDERCNS
jgi:hypothetical protein